MNAKPPGTPANESHERQIEAWRTHLRRSRAVTAADAEELEDHLREQIASLRAQGLSDEEAFLVAVRRMGAVDDLTREFAREHSDRLWKQLVLSGNGAIPGAESLSTNGSRRMWVALALAVAAGLAIKLPQLFGIPLDADRSLFYPLNLSFFVLPFIAAYFAWDRSLSRSGWMWVGGAFLLSAIAVNAYPFVGEADTAILTAIHLPLALWLAVGVAYVGGRWQGNDRRMDFIRFTGELFIYFVLIALGGGVLIALTFGLFQAIGIDPELLVSEWIVPVGAAGAAVVATWLVEAKQSVIENMAPVLARIFVPLFALLLLAFVLTMAVTGRGIDVEREILILIDLLLVVVFGLLLYSISARDPLAPPGIFDWLHLTLVGAALVVDVLALWAIGARISEMGWTPNRFAALGLNVVLLVNLAGSAVLYVRFLRGSGPFSRLWGWQTTYLYVLAGWAAVVAFLFPLIFGFS
jgi:hypothetical protein